MQLNLNGGAGCGVTEDAASGAMAAVSGATGSRRPSDQSCEIVPACIGFGFQSNVLPVATSLVSNQGFCTSKFWMDKSVSELRNRFGMGWCQFRVSYDGGFGE
jgi:hypothetical protein